MTHAIAASTGASGSIGKSLFAGVDVCELAGLILTPQARRPRFDHDVWVFDLADAHRMMGENEKRWDFTAIVRPGWRVLAKELMLALLAPAHPAVAVLPHAHRARLSPRTCRKHLQVLTRWLNWLHERSVGSLREVTQDHCDEFLQAAFTRRDVHGQPTARSNTPGAVAASVWVVQLISLYGDLFSQDRYGPGFTPWDGQTANIVAGHHRRGENRTPPVPAEILQPLLAASLFLVQVVGPHLPELLSAFRAAPAPAHDGGSAPPGALSDAAIATITANLTDRIREGAPLLRLPDAVAADRIKKGWRPDDPLLSLNMRSLAQLVGYNGLRLEHVDQIRPQLEQAAAALGIEHLWGRVAALVDGADGGGPRPWTRPVGYLEIRGLHAAVMTACIVVTAAAVSGMRTSELMELRVGCCQPAQTVSGGGQRFRLSGKVIKGRKFGGEHDEWVVISEAADAVALVERLTDAVDGQPLFGCLTFHLRYRRFRNWINSDAGRHLGLAPIPAGPVSLSMLRRTLAQELARRPAGLLATKIQLKHISTVTSEGYANRPGGSQALFHGEVQQLEEQHHLQLTIAAFRDFQSGVLPAGPGARSLIDTFRRVDAELVAEPAAPTVLDNERRIENLLRAQAGTLHVGAANYCWFQDPSKALCLRLAGTTTATRPLIGLCDSARCPQATHHPCHRPVWADQAATLEDFILSPRTPRGEQARLRLEHERTSRVLATIDAANPAQPTESPCP